MTAFSQNLSGENAQTEKDGFLPTLDGKEMVIVPRTASALVANVSAAKDDSNVKWMDVTLEQGGTLAEALGDRANTIDSLVVRGPINAADFSTLWSASFNGQLEVINLEHAAINGDSIPTQAFWNQTEQLRPEGQYVYTYPILLRRIMLPEGLKEIGSAAFYLAVDLEVVNLPSTLRTLGSHCFSDCYALRTDPLVFPEGMEEIGDYCFLNCRNLKSRAVLPSTIKKIDEGAFFSAKITSINFPEGLTTLGSCAFYGSGLKEVVLPSTCQNMEGDGHFEVNYSLEKLVLMEGLTHVTNSLANSCTELKEVHFPSTISTVELGALYMCKSLQSLYCAAPQPPFCYTSSINTEETPFQYAAKDATVYVPVGTADLYRNATGWNYFTNFVEISEFPYATGIPTVQDEACTSQDAIYDLSGRKVETPQPGHLYIIGGKKVLR